jgi:hypothetical protein
MKKFFVYLSMLFMAMSLTFSFTSCGGDDLEDQFQDDEEYNNNPKDSTVNGKDSTVATNSIVGIWKETENGYYVFTSDGKCYNYSTDNDFYYNASVGTYTYNGSELTWSFPTSVSSTEQGTLQYIEGNNVSSDFNVSVLGGTNMTLDQFGYTKTYEKVTSVPFISKMIEKFDATGMDYDAVSLGLDAKWSLMAALRTMAAKKQETKMYRL